MEENGGYRVHGKSVESAVVPRGAIGYNDARGMKTKAIAAPPKTDDSGKRGLTAGSHIWKRA